MKTTIRWSHRSLRAASIAAILGLTSCATGVNPVSGRVERATMSEEQEIAAGRSNHAEVLAQYGRYPNDALQQYVNGVGQKLAAQSHRANLHWTFTVLDSPEINAFATPGGYVYVTRGIMAYLDSEAELAGVLGHEIGHVTARHGVHQQRDAGIAQGAAILGTFLGAYLGGESGAKIGGQVAGGAAQAGFMLPRSREHEFEADRLGAEYLNRINLDPDIMIRVINVLKLQEDYAADQARAGNSANVGNPRMPGWMSTHPSNDQRLNQIRAVADGYSGKYGDAGRTRYLQAINGMTFGDGREQGIARGRNFYHEPLGFTLRTPDGWQFQNAATQLTVISPDRSAGVIVKLSPKTHNNRPEALRQLLQPEGGRVDNTTINNLPAARFQGSKQGQPLEATAITHRDNDFVLLLAGQPQSQANYRGQLLQIVNSFRAMNADDVRAARPYVVRTVAMPRATNADGFRELTHNAVELVNPEPQLRLLNQVYPQGEIAAGQLVKTIR